MRKPADTIGEIDAYMARLRKEMNKTSEDSEQMQGLLEDAEEWKSILVDYMSFSEDNNARNTY